MRRLFGPLLRATSLLREVAGISLRLAGELANAVAAAIGDRGALFWSVCLTAIGLFIYLPGLGSYPLWDPWEPHYTQVAWEMQERGTWMNPWYTGLDNWWSKPILMLWMLRASLSLFWDPFNHFVDVHFIARLPFATFAVAGAVMQYDWSRRLFGNRVGVLSGLALMTAPQYLVIGRQVMVDVPFVATYAAAMGYLAVGLFTPRTGGWWSRQWPFIAFWSLQALSVLAKGFVPPFCAVIVLAAYWAATFRWRDYIELTAGRYWPTYLVKRGLLAIITLGLTAWLVYLLSRASMPRREADVYRAIVAAAGALVVFLGVFHDLPPSRHALRLLQRIRAWWGLVLFFAIGAPWFIYMSLEHGWPYWNEWLYYHHLGRAAGTIDKPSNTFDYYVRQIAVALFPWSGFLAAALWRFLSRCSPMRSIAERRNAYVLMAALIPFLFFSLSGTKFAHYIFPVVPFLGVIVAAVLVWLDRKPEQRSDLGESSPNLGPTVPAYLDGAPWYERAGAKGDLIIFTAISLVCFGVVAHDLVLDFRHFLRLFIYYFNRTTPHAYYPFIELQQLFFPLGILIGTLLLGAAVRWWHRAGVAAGAVALACYLGWVTMPAMEATYSFEPFVHAYRSMAQPDEELAQYNDWQQPVRSVMFLFKNRCQHLRTNKQAKVFLQRPGRKFVLVDRNKLPALRRVAREAGVSLYVVFDGHPYARMVSTEPNDQDGRQVAGHILEELPPSAQKNGANFSDKIELAGWELKPSQARPGESVSVSFYYRCLALMDRDWQIFIHGDGSSGGSHRLHIDHYPVGGLYPTTEWQVGEIVRDTFEVQIPGDYPYDAFTLWNGWYIDQNRLELKNNVANDRTNRVRGPRVRVIQR